MLDQFSVFTLEALNSSGGIDKLLLPGEKRVAAGADIKPEIVVQSGPGLPFGSAGTGNFPCFILGMNTFFHNLGQPLYLKLLSGAVNPQV